MKLHKNILAWQIPYFDKLFSFCENLDQKEFTVQVEDPEVARLLILSSYGEEIDFSQRQILQLFKLKSFFCLDFNSDL